MYFQFGVTIFLLALLVTILALAVNVTRRIRAFITDERYKPLYIFRVFGF